MHSPSGVSLANLKSILTFATTSLNSDMICVIDNGQVVKTGLHDELLKTSEIYKNFYEKQIKREEW